MLELAHLNIRSLMNFSYKHDKSKKTLVLGASGSGKSSLLNVIQGTLLPAQGNVSNSFKLTRTIYQDLNLINRLSASENASLVLEPSQMLDFQQLAQKLNIQKFDKPVKTLSMGERQRIGVALALALKPDLLLADEPTSHLDPEMAIKTLEILLRHSRSLILVSHDHRFKTYFSSVVEI
jgi:ABC-type lipoprotein export system ATPase subunit